MAETPRSHRRQFLQGFSLRDAVRHRLEKVAEGVEREIDHQEAERAADGTDPGTWDARDGRLDNSPVAPENAPPSYLLEVSRSAMACEFCVQLNAGQSAEATDVALQALDLLEPLEQQLSVYRPDSELSRVNARAGLGWVPLPAELFSLLQRASELSAATSGAFDIMAGPLVKAWGFYRREGCVPDDDALSAAQACSGPSMLELNPQALSVRLARRGAEINPGAIGKGYALDRCTAYLRRHGVTDFLIHGGRSSILASGHRWQSAGQHGWRVAIRHPLRPDRPAVELRLCDQSLSTSGCGTQYFYHQGVRYGHILDPRSGLPAQGVLSASAVTPDAATADALSTAFYVLGVEATAEYCQQHPEVGAVLMVPGPRAGEIQLETFGPVQII